MLHRLARACYRRRRIVLAGWLALLIGMAVLSATAGGKDTTNFSLPGTESQQAINLLKARFPSRSGDSGQIVFAAPGAGGVDAPAVKARIVAATDAAKSANPHVSGVVSPFAPQGTRQISADRHVAFATVLLDDDAHNLPASTGSVIEARVVSAAHPGADLAVDFGSGPFQAHSPPSGTEGIGVLAAIIILIVAFGSLLAMAMPIMVALFGIFISLAFIALLANVMEIAVFAPLIAAMIGIGVGIDYALFIVTRFRQGLHDGLSPEDAVVTSIATSGRAVLFAGITVVIALMGMFIMGLSFVDGLAIGAAFAVLVTMMASVTLLPAVLGFVGTNIDKFHVPAFHRSQATSDSRGGFWFRWSRTIQRRPWPFAMAALGLLLVMAFPVTRLHLGFPDNGNDPAGTTTRKAYDALARGFGPGYNGQLLIAIALPHPSDMAAAQRLDAAVRADGGAAAVSPVIPNSATHPTAAIINVIPKTAPQSAATATYVKHLRNHVIVPAIAGTELTVHSAGNAAFSIDITKKMSGRLPLFFGAVIALSFLLLMIVFRSILVPLKAALMNLLSIAAAFGILVAVFQWGWGASLIGVGKQPIVAFSPMMLFAILFGLSMDYEVFLLSRVKEEHDRTHDNGLAVADGLAATARVITAAAAIMVTVFLSFMLQTDATTKMFGLGLGMAILIDATVVRMVLVPATMELLGEANWWLPPWFDRILPRISVDGLEAPAQVPDDNAEPALV